MKDTARVLGRMYDGIEYRGFGQELVRSWQVRRRAGVERPDQRVPPTQMLCDILTMMEHSNKHSARSPIVTWAMRATTWATR